MDQYELEKYALDRKISRARVIDPLLTQLPKRRSKTDELSLLANLVEASHSLLIAYDGLPEPPALAGSIETTFDAAVNQLADLIAEREAARKA